MNYSPSVAAEGCAFGNHDSYIFFIERACDLVCRNGLVSYVTPDSWIKIPQSQRLREMVLTESSVLMLTMLPQHVFPRVSANCIVFLLERSGNNQMCEIRILRPDSELASLSTNTFDDAYQINVSTWKSSEDKQFQVFQTQQAGHLIHKIKSSGRPAVEFLDVMQGIVPYSKENHSSDLIKSRGFHSKRCLRNTDHG